MGIMQKRHLSLEQMNDAARSLQRLTRSGEQSPHFPVLCQNVQAMMPCTGSLYAFVTPLCASRQPNIHRQGPGFSWAGRTQDEDVAQQSDKIGQAAG